MHRRELPIIQPCHEDWERMRPLGESTRHCERCELAVHELDRMDEGQVRGLLAGADRVCVRYRVDARGRVRLRPTSVVAVALLAGCATPVAPATESPETHAIELSDAQALEPEGAPLWRSTAMGVVGRPLWDPRSTLTPDAMRKFLIEPAPVAAPSSFGDDELP